MTFFGCFIEGLTVLLVIFSALIVSLAQKPAKSVVPVPVMSFEAASSKGLIDFSFNGNGGSSGDVITLTIRRAVRRPLRLRLTAGTVLRSASASVQNMIVTTVKGQRIDAARYRVVDLIELPDDDERVYLLEAYCLDFDKANPGASDRFSLAAVNGSALALINSIPKKRRSIPVVQAALWLAAGVSNSAIRQRFEMSEADLLTAEICVELWRVTNSRSAAVQHHAGAPGADKNS